MKSALPADDDDPAAVSTEVAQETREASVREEREVVGDQPDVSDLVPPDDAQSSADRP